MSWLALLPLGLVALTVVHASTTTNDPFRALALQVPKKPELPICCLRPQQPLDNNDEEILLSFEDWKQQQGDVINRTTDTNSNDDPAPVHVHDVPATPQREEQQKPPPHFRVPLTDRFNYASSECSARVHFSHRDAKSTSSILSSKRDRYMLSPCNAENQFVIVELCEDIRIDTIQLANFEFFSGVFKDFKLSVAKTDITAEGSFTDAGVFRAKNVRGVQSFHPPRSLSDFYRYIRIDFLSHYGTEFYCPVSLLRVYGLTHLEEWKWDAWEQESKEKHETPKAGIIAKDESTLSLKVETQPEQTTSTQSVSNVNVTDTPSVTSTVIAVTPTHDSTSAPPSEPTIPPPSTPIVSEDNPSLLSSPAPTAESTTFAEDSSTLISQKLPSAEMTPLPNSTNSIPSSIHSALRSSSYTDSPSSSSSIPKPSNSPSSLQNPGGESIYRTIMNRLTALEANHTLYVRYVEQQTSGVREVLRRMGEDVGRLEGIVRAQEQAHSRSLKVSEERIRLELGILIRRLDSLQSEIELEKTLGVVQVCLLAAVFGFLWLTRSTNGDQIQMQGGAERDGETKRKGVREWGRRHLRSFSGDWSFGKRKEVVAATAPQHGVKVQFPSKESAPLPLVDNKRHPVSKHAASASPIIRSLSIDSKEQHHGSRSRTPSRMRPHIHQHHQHHHNQHQSNHSQFTLATPPRLRTSAIPLQRSSSGANALHRSARRWARTAHLHEVRGSAHQDTGHRRRGDENEDPFRDANAVAGEEKGVERERRHDMLVRLISTDSDGWVDSDTDFQEDEERTLHGNSNLAEARRPTGAVSVH